jgi:hypothetical protein
MSEDSDDSSDVDPNMWGPESLSKIKPQGDAPVEPGAEHHPTAAKQQGGTSTSV